MVSWMLPRSDCRAAVSIATFAFAVVGPSFLALHPVPSAASIPATVASARLFFKENIEFSNDVRLVKSARCFRMFFVDYWQVRRPPPMSVHTRPPPHSAWTPFAEQAELTARPVAAAQVLAGVPAG